MTDIATAAFAASTRPAIDRSDAGLVLVGEWAAGTPERQQAFVTANADEWRRTPWPEGLLRDEILVGTDGSTVVHYHQWTGEVAYDEFARDSSSQRTRVIDRAVPGMRRQEPIRYEVYRGHRVGDQSRVPGCVVAVRIGADGPGRARRWIDAVLAALETDPESRPGLISATFHIDAEGTRIFNYAEWTDVDEHVKALDNVEGSVGHGSEWDRVRTMSGVSQLGFERFRPGRSLVGPEWPVVNDHSPIRSAQQEFPMTDDKLRLAVIVGSTRRGRFAPTVAEWFTRQVTRRDTMAVDVIDLAEVELPVLDDFGESRVPEVEAVSARLARADAFVVITPEYNHSFPAPLKSLLDRHKPEWQAKPVGFVSYGGMAGGLRAVEQLRLVFAELHAVTVRDTVSFHGAGAAFDRDGRPKDVPGAHAAAKVMLDALAWWAGALRDARTKTPYAA